MTTMVAVAAFAVGFLLGAFAFCTILWIAKHYPNEDNLNN